MESKKYKPDEKDTIKVSGSVTDYTLYLNNVTGDTLIQHNGDLIAIVIDAPPVNA